MPGFQLHQNSSTHKNELLAKWENSIFSFEVMKHNFISRKIMKTC